MFLKFELPEGTIFIDPEQIAAVMDRPSTAAVGAGLHDAVLPTECTILFKGTQQNVGLPMSAEAFLNRVSAARSSIKVIDA